MVDSVSNLSYGQRMIKKATGSRDKILPALEFIMRHEVFHGTLDWQSWQEFRAGAFDALRIYMRDPQPYDAELAHNAAVFRRMQAQRALADAQQSGDRSVLKSARAALYRARRREDKARERLGSCLGVELASPPHDPSAAPACVRP